jgi:MFS family permease
VASPAETAKVFRAVAHRPALRRVLAAYFFFNAAEWATWVAMLVFAFDHGGATAAGAVALIQLIPCMLVAPLASIVGDELPRDRALRLGYLAQGVAMGTTALALFMKAPVWMVYPLAAVSASTMTLTRPVHHAILPQLAETPQELTASNSMSGTLEGLSLFVGPVLSGVLLAAGDRGCRCGAGAWVVYAVFAGTQMLAFVLTIGLPRHPVVREDHGRASVLADAREGVHALRREPGALLLVVMVGAQHVVVGMLDILAVLLALGVLRMGVSGPGILTAAAGVGGLIGAVATVILIGRTRLAPALLLGILATGLPLAAIGLGPGIAVVLGLLLVYGVGQAFFSVAGRTLLQRTVDDDVLARVFGVQEGLMMAGLAIGSVLAPILVKVFGARGAFVAAGVFLPAAGVATWRRMRSLDARAVLPGAELSLLRSLDLFAPLDQPVLERLSWNLIRADVASGTVVITEGDPGDRFYIVMKGRAEVTVGGRTVAALGPGDYFGEIALLRDVPRTATVTAWEDLQLLALERDEFLAAVTGSRAAAEVAQREASRRLDEHGLGPRAG